MIDPSERVVRLKAMLAQTAPSGTIESVMEQRSLTAGPSFEGARRGAAAETETQIRSGLEKLAQGREDLVTPHELNRLEAIVMPENRPVVFIREAGYDPLVGIWEHLNHAAVRDRVTPLLRSIGRIELQHPCASPSGARASSSATIS